MNPGAKCRIAAVVPMRHHSERVPGKNFREIAGVPLYHHIVRCLLACTEIDRILIDTDSPVILEDAREHFPGIELHERPAKLRDGHISMNAVLANSIRQIPAEYYLQTHSTNPLLRPATVTAAITKFLAALPGKDSMFSVTRLQTRLWNGDGAAVNHDPARLLRTQDLAPLYEENSCFYLFSGESFRACGNRIGNAPMMFEVDPLEAVDIDEEVHFRLAEFLLQDRRGSEGGQG